MLIHECIHVLQRKYRDLFYKLYTDYWHFIKVDKIYNGNKYYQLSRYNPDGPDLNWVYNFDQDYIWLLSIYHKNAEDISDVEYVGIYLKKKVTNIMCQHILK